MITVPIEDLEGLLAALEGFFGPDVFVEVDSSEQRIRSLAVHGTVLKTILKEHKMNKNEKTKMAIKQIREIADQNDLMLRIFTRGDVSGMTQEIKNEEEILFDLTDDEFDKVKEAYENCVIDQEWEYLEQLAREAKANQIS